MRDQQTGVTVDKEDVLYLVNERVSEHDLGEGGAGAPSLPSPFDPAPSEAKLQCLIERLESLVDCLPDRLADRWDNQRIEDVEQRPRITPDRALCGLLQSRGQHLPEPRVARDLRD